MRTARSSAGDGDPAAAGPDDSGPDAAATAQPADAPPEGRAALAGASVAQYPPLDLAAIRERLAAHEPRILPWSAFEASVAVVLRPSAAGPEALFIERARKPGDPWSGQMAFPGGRRDPDDRDLRHTAERETREEVGLGLAGARAIGRLDDQSGQRAGQGRRLRIAAFAYEVGPRAGNDLTPNHEVAEALWAPLQWFEDPARVIDYRHPPYPETSFPGVVVGHPDRHIVWGLTFRFLAKFFEILRRPFPAAN